MRHGRQRDGSGQRRSRRDDPSCTQPVDPHACRRQRHDRAQRQREKEGPELAGRETGATQLEAFRDRIRAHIGQHLRDPHLSIDSIAQALNCSKRHLHNAFSAEDDTPAHYILRRRLQACMRDLQNPAHAQRTITDIAFSWGFNNGAHFSRVFREHTGLTPSDFREAMLRRPLAGETVGND